MTAYSIPSATAENPWATELLIRRSRFLAQGIHAPTLDAARAFVAARRERYPGATHHCWACVAGAPGSTGQVGCSDDGEPHGTAGRPMLQVLLHAGVGEVCVVVTRWFGGIKLGTGGLVRAYQDSVRRNLEGLALVTRVERVYLAITLEYAHIENVRRRLADFDAVVMAEDFQDRARLTVCLPGERARALAQAVSGLSRGSAVCEEITP